MIDISDVDREVMLANFRSGMGFTASCLGLNLDPQEVSEFMVQHPNFYQECKDIAARGFKVLAVAANEAMNKRRFGQARQLKDFAKEHVNQIWLWEEYCLHDEFLDHRFDAVLDTVGNLTEMATAVGWSQKEFNEYIYGTESIRRWLVQKNLIR